MEAVALTELHTFRFQGYEDKRKVASFGYDWSFEKQQLSKGREIPWEFEGLIEKVTQRITLPGPLSPNY